MYEITLGRKSVGRILRVAKRRIRKHSSELILIIKDIQRGTFDGIGKPEPLKDNLRGWWSRRIDETNRIVYCEKENAIIIASCKGHYND